MSLPADHAAFVRTWISAWNARNLDAVLALYDESCTFSSPLVSRYADAPGNVLTGKSALHAYWTAALARLPDLHFEFVAALAGVNVLTVVYRGHRGLAAEVFEFGESGRVVRGQACYDTTEAS